MTRTSFPFKAAGALIVGLYGSFCTEAALATTVVVPDGQIQLTNSLVSPNPVVINDLSSSASDNSGYVTAGANPLGQPSVSASVSAPLYSPTSPWTGSARASLGYWIYVGGADSTISIPLLFSANLSASASGLDIDNNQAGFATAQFGLQEYNANPITTPNSFVAQLFQQSVGVQLPTHGSQAMGIADAVDVNAGDFIGVTLIADVSAQDGGVTSAFVDPYFQIDPTFLSSHPGFTLSFSPFVGNDPPPTGAVPEPATWAMMLMGFVFIGATMRSRKAVCFSRA